ADDRPDAYEQLVDRLLRSPQYGERWAQFWLDLARFAETDGFEHDKLRKNAWRYRDWVVQALNDDMSYAQFAQWQVAGDLLSPQDAAAHVATAFCLSGPDMPDINSQEERRHVLLNEMTATVGAVFLGLQVGCAQCHDHMYDPISQADFYRLRSFFQPAVHVKLNETVSLLAERSNVDRDKSYFMVRGDWRRPGPEVQPAFLRIANPQRHEVQSEHAGRGRVELANWLTSPQHPLTARVIVNRIWQQHFGQALSSSPSDLGVMGVEPTHPELLDWLATSFVDSGWQVKRLHRLIVTSATYRQAGMSQLSSNMPNVEVCRGVDPANELLWSFPTRRLTAEMIRDAMFAMSGSLVTEMGGPGVCPPMPTELVATLLKGQWHTSPRVADHYRRSVYVFARRNLRYPLFAAFDRPAANDTCAARQSSTTATQSLLLINSAVSLDAARRLAGRVWDEAEGESPGVVRQAFLRALGRPPTSDELASALEFLEAETALITREQRPVSELALPITSTPIAESARAAAFSDLCLALINTSEFLFVD
ncbi:MAG: DUF1553 domain-containing protein, partial [Planctomycetales bacterium]|nr:DUF1553 domain-containing protein [Planctomycetales bacterium]